MAAYLMRDRFTPDEPTFLRADVFVGVGPKRDIPCGSINARERHWVSKTPADKFEAVMH
jgi:hypothetical protein